MYQWLLFLGFFSLKAREGFFTEFDVPVVVVFGFFFIKSKRGIFHRVQCTTWSLIGTGNQSVGGGNVLFNNTLNTFYLRLYGVGHMVKNQSDSERGKILPPYRLLFPISSKGSFYMHHPTDGKNTYHSLCYTSCGALAGKRNSSMGPPVGECINPLMRLDRTLGNENQSFNAGLV